MTRTTQALVALGLLAVVLLACGLLSRSRVALEIGGMVGAALFLFAVWRALRDE